MAGFENTHLWQSTLAKQLAPDEFERQREFLRSGYESFRENAGVLAGEIARDLPDFTVHDITHLDALWEIASIICGTSYYLNPAEAFVLGGAFLIHDLGMGLAAYPDGIDELKNTTLWKDTIANLSNRVSSVKIENAQIEKEATCIVLRALHAKHAEKLALISWGKDSNLFLISNPELREAFGTIIGLIAHSHWWFSDEIEKRLPSSLGAFERLPNEWGIDPIKIACIMRVADAAHIDARRAPAILNAFRKPNEHAQHHWLFQQKLYQPHVESERLVYTSKSSFSADEFSSWWLCYETLKMIDHELRDVDSILGDSKRPRFQAKGVAAINSIKHLSRLIGIDGWYPVNTEVHVGNIAKLVKNLGGEQLYGTNAIVPLRELIQNSCDAVRARRLLEQEPSDWGSVTVRTGRDESGFYIEVEDNGVGMSIPVLTGPFLDFGTSFWGTSLMHEELPGLESKGFSSTGKYGVGFFSVFMWGDSVSVTTRRYEDSRQSTKVLIFENGLSSRPLLREATGVEYVKDGGTKVRVSFSSEMSYRKIFCRNFDEELSLRQIVEDLCPCIDVNLFVEDLNNNDSGLALGANDWLDIVNEDFIRRALGNHNYIKLNSTELNKLIKLSENITTIVRDGRAIGRGFLSGLSRYYGREHQASIEGVVEVGGFRTSGLTGIIGFFSGVTMRASRDIAIPIANGFLLKEWATKQSDALLNYTNEEEQIECSSIIRALGGNPRNLVVAIHRDGGLNIQDFNAKLEKIDGEIVFVSNNSFFLLAREHGKIALNENVFVVNSGIPGILQVGRMEDDWIDWPSKETEWFHEGSIKGLLMEKLSSVWKCSLGALIDSSATSDDEKIFSYVIGKVKRKNITCKRVDIFRKPYN
ncbi:MAG: ATP-binding protein [Cellvibrio sp.]|uniref:HD domain-containing protein n=1 Tax=Cellvibrio sp. TaxID=1965322 RepID=UPI0027262C87|nr:ATP-binding protein [Cellvibrio sp.]